MFFSKFWMWIAGGFAVLVCFASVVFRRRKTIESPVQIGKKLEKWSDSQDQYLRNEIKELERKSNEFKKSASVASPSDLLDIFDDLGY